MVRHIPHDPGGTPWDDDVVEIYCVKCKVLCPEVNAPRWGWSRTLEFTDAHCYNFKHNNTGAIRGVRKPTEPGTGVWSVRLDIRFLSPVKHDLCQDPISG